MRIAVPVAIQHQIADDKHMHVLERRQQEIGGDAGVHDRPRWYHTVALLQSGVPRHPRIPDPSEAAWSYDFERTQLSDGHLKHGAA
jgi:hypothetical protein